MRSFSVDAVVFWRPNLGRLTWREAAALRLATRHDTAFGSPEFVEEMERKYGFQFAR